MREDKMYVRLSGLAIALSLIAAPLASAKDAPPAFLAQLQKELLVKTHRTRAPIGTLVQYESQSKRRVFKRVDTEVYPAGVVKYLCTKGEFGADGSPILNPGAFFNKPFYVAPEKIRGLAPGTSVGVREIELEKDRLELSLDTLGAAPYAKIRLMLGEQYAQTQTVDSIMAVLAQVLVVETYEARRALLEQYAAVSGRLGQTRSAYSVTQGTATARMQAAEAHRAALAEAEQIAQALTAAGSPPAGAGSYADERLAVERTIASLQSSARSERLADIERELRDVRQQIDGLLPRVRSASAPQQEQDLQASEALLAKQAGLYAERSKLGQPESDRERTQEAQDRKVVDAARGQLGAQRAAADRAQELARLEGEYASLTSRVADARRAYSQAFGSPTQAQEVQKLLRLLDQLQQNRARAGRAGSTAAAAEASDVAKEIQRMRMASR